jgi:flagellar biosynthesis protein FlhG
MQSRESPKPSLRPAFGQSLPRGGRKGPVRTIAVTGGKGGVGKSSLAVNLAVALGGLGQRTLLLDADLGLANVDVLLGLHPRATLADLVAGQCEITDILLEGPNGILVVPAASGRRQMAQLSTAEHIGLVNVISTLENDLDVLVVDTAAGLSDSVLTFCQASQEVVLVVCDEPASITDAYALIKVLVRERGVARVQVVANMVRDANEGRTLYNKLVRVCERFLTDISLNYLGCVPQDDWLRLAVQRQQPVVKAYPSSPSARAINEIANLTARWQAPEIGRGGVEFFFERLLTRGVPA